MRSIVLLVLLGLTMDAAPGPSGVETLDWMAGSWAGSARGIDAEEIWTAPRGGALLGVHRDVQEGRMSGFEFFRIQADEKGPVYWASPGGRPATAFRLKESGPRRVVFENPEHDFPQRILYWLAEDGALHARVEGTLKGKLESEEWRWTRASR
jgi:hypothetical protein